MESKSSQPWWLTVPGRVAFAKRVSRKAQKDPLIVEYVRTRRSKPSGWVPSYEDAQTLSSTSPGMDDFLEYSHRADERGFGMCGNNWDGGVLDQTLVELALIRLSNDLGITLPEWIWSTPTLRCNALSLLLESYYGFKGPRTADLTSLRAHLNEAAGLGPSTETPELTTTPTPTLATTTTPSLTSTPPSP